MDSAGKVTTGTNFYVKNDSVAPVDITNIEVAAQNNWTLVDFNTDFSKEKVDLQEYGISFFDDEVSSDGTVSLNSSNWGSITGGNTLTIAYNANVAAQSDSINNKTIGLVELTIGWSDTVTYGGSESEVADISLYYNYSYVDSQGNETDTAGYVLTLTEDFATAVNSTEAEFTDDDGNVLWETGDALPNPGSMYDGVPVTSYRQMFYEYTEMISVDITGWDSSNVTAMYRMFDSCSSLIEVFGMDSLNMKNIHTIGCIFNGCLSITTLDFLKYWDVSNLPSFYGMVINCSNLEDISALANWDISNATGLSAIFSGCTNLADLDAISGWDTGNITTMQNMFAYCTSLTDLDAISDWDTSSLTITTYMFQDCSSLLSLDAISGWDTSNVTTMLGMFRFCTNLTTLDLSGWDLGNVTTTTNMFSSCSILTTIYVGSEADAAIIASSSNFPSGCIIYIGTPEESSPYRA